MIFAAAITMVITMGTGMDITIGTIGTETAIEHSEHFALDFSLRASCFDPSANSLDLHVQ